MPECASRALTTALGMKLVLKVETVNPIRCFKGRGAEFFASQFTRQSSNLVCASAGNFGLGLAYAARKRGFHLTVFAPLLANPSKLDAIRQLGATVRLFGNDFHPPQKRPPPPPPRTHTYFVVPAL